MEIQVAELIRMKAKYENEVDPYEKAMSYENLSENLEDLVVAINNAGQRQIGLGAPQYGLARRFFNLARSLLEDTDELRPFFSTEQTRLELLCTTYQNLGQLEKASRNLRGAMQYNAKAMEVAVQRQALPDEDLEDNLQEEQRDTASDSRALLQWCRKGQEAKALLLLQRDHLSLSLTDNEGNTALHYASQQRLPEVAQRLCKLGAPIDAVNNGGQVPVHFSASVSLSVTKILLHAGADIFRIDHSGNTALHYACLANLPDVARLLLDRGSDFQIANKTGNTPLHYAVTSGMTSAVELLLVHRADIDARDHEGNTPLHYACSLELPSMAQVLAKHKPRLDLVNRGGNTALLYACSNSMESAALLLIEKEADVTLTDARGNGPLHYACANQLESLGRLLVGRHDVDCALPNHQGNTPLHYACSSNSPALVKLLVAKKVDLHAVDRSGCTPLHYACLNEDAMVAEYLISKGASVEMRNTEGETALDYAMVAS